MIDGACEQRDAQRKINRCDLFFNVKKDAGFFEISINLYSYDLIAIAIKRWSKRDKRERENSKLNEVCVTLLSLTSIR